MSNELKHTPGPWKYDNHNNEDYFDITSETGEIIASISISEAITDKPGETEANAKLIAAAPELLEALKTFRTYFEKDGQVTGALWSIANDAIKKATE